VDSTGILFGFFGLLDSCRPAEGSRLCVMKAVVINLGTNDNLPAEPTDPTTQFKEAYLALLIEIASHYGNQVQFFLACGPMSTAYCPEVFETIDAAMNAGLKASFLDQRGLIDSACCGHPSLEDDRRMASAGAAAIAAVMGW